MPLQKFMFVENEFETPKPYGLTFGFTYDYVLFFNNTKKTKMFNKLFFLEKVKNIY